MKNAELRWPESWGWHEEKIVVKTFFYPEKTEKQRQIERQLLVEEFLNKCQRKAINNNI